MHAKLALEKKPCNAPWAKSRKAQACCCNKNFQSHDDFTLMLEGEGAEVVYAQAVPWPAVQPVNPAESIPTQWAGERVLDINGRVALAAIELHLACFKTNPVELLINLPRLGGVKMKLIRQGGSLIIELNFACTFAKQSMESNRGAMQRWLSVQLEQPVSLTLHSDAH